MWSVRVGLRHPGDLPRAITPFRCSTVRIICGFVPCLTDYDVLAGKPDALSARSKHIICVIRDVFRASGTPSITKIDQEKSRRSIVWVVLRHRHCCKFGTRVSPSDFERVPLKLQIFVCSVAIGPLGFGFESMSRLGFRAGFWALFRRRKRKAAGPDFVISEPSGRDSAT